MNAPDLIAAKRKADVLRLWAAGETTTRIAVALGITRSAVTGIINRAGKTGQQGVATPKKRGRRPTGAAKPESLTLTLPAQVAQQLTAMRAAAALAAKKRGETPPYRANAALAASILMAVLADDAAAHVGATDKQTAQAA